MDLQQMADVQQQETTQQDRERGKEKEREDISLELRCVFLSPVIWHILHISHRRHPLFLQGEDFSSASSSFLGKN